MQEKHLAIAFAALTVVGVVVPYAALVPFLIEHGLDTAQIVDEITATRLGAFAWLDVLISALVLLLAAFGTGWITTGRALWVALAMCLVGVSAGLPPCSSASSSGTGCPPMKRVTLAVRCPADEGDSFDLRREPERSHRALERGMQMQPGLPPRSEQQPLHRAVADEDPPRVALVALASSPSNTESLRTR